MVCLPGSVNAVELPCQGVVGEVLHLMGGGVIVVVTPLSMVTETVGRVLGHIHYILHVLTRGEGQTNLYNQYTTKAWYPRVSKSILHCLLITIF